MEAVTAFVEGPACFLVVAALLYRLPWRYVAVILVSLGQLYGDVLYFATCYHEGGCRLLLLSPDGACARAPASTPCI
jgi:hypothetical protein